MFASLDHVDLGHGCAVRGGFSFYVYFTNYPITQIDLLGRVSWSTPTL